MLRVPLLHVTVNTKLTSATVLIALGLVLFCGTFGNFPGMQTVTEIWIGLVVICFLVPYTCWKMFRRLRFSAIELYVVGIIIFVPLASALAAWHTFGQPIPFGVLAQRNLALSAIAIAAIVVLKNKPDLLINVDGAIRLLSWTSLILYAGMAVFLDPLRLAQSGSSLVTGVNSSPTFKFDNTFILFGVLYYSCAGFRCKSLYNYMLALPFLLWLFFGAGGRSMLLALSLGFLLYTLYVASASRIVTYIPKLLLCLVALAGLLWMISPAYVSDFGARFVDAITAILTGDRTGDASANARISEFAMILPHLQKNWMFGNGDISNQWRGGYESALGAYFFPSDLGIFGVLFVYGLVGAAIFGIQFYFAFRYSRRQPDPMLRNLSDCMLAFMIYLAIHSLVTGRFAFYPQIGLFCVAIMYLLSVMRPTRVRVVARRLINPRHLQA